MTTRSALAAGLALAAALAGCATIRGSGVDREDPTLPSYLAHIPIYWAGTQPQCGVEPVRTISALSRAALRQRTYELGADAVIDARMRSQASQYTVSRNRPVQTTVSMIYSGVAVRLPSKCMK